MSFQNLKKNSQSTISRLTQELDKLNKGSESYKDDRFWKPEVDQAGNGFAVIRFLPAVDGEDVPWTRIFTHGFKGPGGWYIENSLTTIGKKDPVSEMNTVLWNSGNEKDKEIARERKRKLSYIANILVVSDPKHPENEGKIFLFKFGKKIFDKIMEKIQPEFADDQAVNVFDFWQGANFKLKIRKVAGYTNYDKSEFDTPSPVLDGDDAKLEALWKKQYALKEFNDPSSFKSYEELKARLDEVLKGDAKITSKTAESFDEFDDEDSAPKSKSAPAMKQKTPPKVSEESEDEEEESALDYFKKLAQDD
jgi:hypothetical protein